MSIITIVPPKRNVGATTSAIVLAVTLARSHRVTLIDADPVGQLDIWAEKGNLPVRLKVISSRGERHIQDEISDATVGSKFIIVDLQEGASRLNSFAIGASDLVIIPMEGEEHDAERAIETFHQVQLDTRMARRETPVRILFVRTESTVLTTPNTLVEQGLESFSYGLLSSPAYTALHEIGGSLYGPIVKQAADVPRAIGNAELLTGEVLEVLGLSEREGRTQEPFLSRTTSGTGRRGGETVQMSVRMNIGDYENFRALCNQERRTNGDMMRELLRNYSRKPKSE